MGSLPFGRCPGSNWAGYGNSPRPGCLSSDSTRTTGSSLPVDRGLTCWAAADSVTESRRSRNRRNPLREGSCAGDARIPRRSTAGPARLQTDRSTPTSPGSDARPRPASSKWCRHPLKRQWRALRAANSRDRFAGSVPNTTGRLSPAVRSLRNPCGSSVGNCSRRPGTSDSRPARVDRWPAAEDNRANCWP